jgi:hypothetical protein
MGGNDQVKDCHNLNLLGFVTKLGAHERMWIGKCLKTLSHSHKWNAAKRRWIPNTYKWESHWKVKSQNVLNFCDKIANNKPYANVDFFIITRNLPIYVTTLFMTTYIYRLFVTNFGRFSTIFQLWQILFILTTMLNPCYNYWFLHPFIWIISNYFHWKNRPICLIGWNNNQN